MRNSKKGFTLIELVIVILIIAILFVVLVPQLSAMVNKAKTAGVQEDFREFSTAAQAVAYEQGGFVGEGADADAKKKDIISKLNANMDAVNAISETDGTMTVQDPWNDVYTFEYTAPAGDDRGSVTFKSDGADGKAGTADDLSIKVSYDENGSVVTETTGFSLNK